MKRTSDHSSVRWLCAVLLAIGMTGWVGAAEPNSVGAGTSAVANDEAVDANSMVKVDPASGRIEEIRFNKNGNIKQALSLLAQYSKKNIVPAAGVDGPVTLTALYDVTFEEALDAILGYGFRYRQEGNFIRVYTAEQYRKMQEDPERMVHRVIPLYYVEAAEAMKLVKPVLSGSASAKVEASTPAETKISGGEGDLGSGGGAGNNLASHDLIIIYDYPENVQRAEAVLREVDVRPQQVLIEATIMAAKLTEDMEFGIDWNLLTGVAINDYAANISGYGTKMETAGFARTPGSKGLTVAFSADNVQAVITALETITDTTLLANPKVLAVNKQEGIVYIGTKLGYESQTSQTQTSTTQSVEFLETGTRLAFRPFIGNDGYIRMDIYPKDSDGVLQSNGLPQETSTELRTNVVVKDGQTVVIGGLFRDSVTTSKSQVPLLGSLPIVGAVFRGSKDTVVRQEVIIVLTPHIIGEPAETGGDARVADIERKREATNNGLFGLDSSKQAENAYARASRCYLEGDIEKAIFNLKIALMLRPTYLEALRLRERIIAETDPEQFRRMDSVVVGEMDSQMAENWSRH
ncbi:MAG TPA: secretin N-terminal domain-containing protein [Sedimentisphaerales bacterium]|nr:secretin N-terminal domain-containing protein [Sedimentisphaerales bacterium]HNU28091.1 secretin N-terminal domain-containing protein [Sedimentisphaerales bacterium]